MTLLWRKVLVSTRIRGIVDSATVGTVGLGFGYGLQQCCQLGRVG
jgi:hypothetical protein